MGMGPAGVFIVESPGVDEIADHCAEGPIVTEMLKLLRMPYVSRRVESRVELERDASIYLQRHFDVLLFSSHGGPGEIALTTGETISVADLFSLYKGPSSTAVIFSSCEVMAGEAMPTALAHEGTPDYVLGYDSDIHWHSAALASVMLMYGLAYNEFGRLLSTLIAIHQCTSVNICGYMRTVEHDTHQWFSTEAFIKHSQATSGAQTALELSVLVAQYMQHERATFQQRSDEYLRGQREIERLNQAGTERHKDARDAADRMLRPSNT